MEYFIIRFPEHCPPADRTDELYDEYRVYQCLPAIPHDILCKFKSSATDTEEEEQRKKKSLKLELMPFGTNWRNREILMVKRSLDY